MSQADAIDLLRTVQMIATNALDGRPLEEHDAHYAVVLPLNGPPAVVTADLGGADWMTERGPGTTEPQFGAFLVSAVRGMRDGLRAVAVVSARRGTGRVDLLLEEHTSTVTEHMWSTDVSSHSWHRENTEAVIWHIPA